MRKNIPEIQKEIVSAIKKNGNDTDYSLFRKMGVKGEINMHQTIQKPLRVSFKTKVLAVAFHEGPNGRLTFNYLVKERGRNERWSLLGEPLKFKESTFQMKRILKRLQNVEVYTTFGKLPEDMPRDEKQKNKELYPEMSESLLGKEPETIQHNITVPRKSFKEYREGLFYFITKSTSSSASEKKFAEAMLEKFSEDKEEIEITKVEAVSLIELYNTIKEKDLFENTIIECAREQQIGAMWEFVWPIAKAYGLKID